MVVGAGTRQTLASYLSIHTVPETTASSGHFWSGLAPCASTTPAGSTSHADSMIPRRATALMAVVPSHFEHTPVSTRAPGELDARYSAWRSRCDRGEAAEEAVLLAVRTGSEVDGVGLAAGASVADLQRPQPVDQDSLSLGIDDLAEELARVGIKGVDATVSEIADQDVAGKLAEARWRLHDAPRRIETAALGEARKHVPPEIKSIDEAAAVSKNAVMLRGVLPRIGDEEAPALEGDVEGRVVERQVGIGERIGRRGYTIERGVVYLDRAGAEVRRIQERVASGVRGDGKPFVDGTSGRSGVRRVVHRDDAVGSRLGGVETNRIDPRVPADDRSVLGGKEENIRRGSRVAVLVHPGDRESL